MMEISELYADIIMDHQRNPRNYGTLEEKDVEVHTTNSSCGDEIFLEIKFDGDKISQIAFHGHGCAISKSSASIMTELVKGISKQKALELSKKFVEMVKIGKTQERELKDAVVFQGVSQYPLRTKCATLSWHALEEALKRTAV